jgi:hypothetical protein
MSFVLLTYTVAQLISFVADWDFFVRHLTKQILDISIHYFRVTEHDNPLPTRITLVSKNTVTQKFDTMKFFIICTAAFALAASAWPFHHHNHTANHTSMDEHGDRAGHGPPHLNHSTHVRASLNHTHGHNMSEYRNYTWPGSSFNVKEIINKHHHSHTESPWEHHHHNHTHTGHRVETSHFAGEHLPHPVSTATASQYDRRSALDPVMQLLTIAPTSNTCDNAPAVGECATSSPLIVSALVNSFAKYGVSCAEEQVALLSWMAFESLDFKYNKNHYPGTPGQGTRCMMSPSFVQQYLKSIPELALRAAALADPAAILELVYPDQYSFAAAAWFYSTHCTEAQKKQVKAGGQNNWASAFITGCIGTTVTDGRIQKWKLANQALGVATTA